VALLSIQQRSRNQSPDKGPRSAQPRLLREAGSLVHPSGCTVAVCDLGTFSGLILVVRRSGSRLTALLEERYTVDLLSDSRKVRRLGRAAFDRAARVLSRFEEAAGQFDVTQSAIVCTSAIREATNRAQFAGSLRRVTTHPVRVLSAQQEATLSAAGAVAGLRLSPRPKVVVDIGGGSTEVSIQNGTQSRFWLAGWGAASATEAWKRASARPLRQRVEFYTQEADRIMHDLSAKGGASARVVGVGGTIVTLAAIHAGLSQFDAKRLHGLTLKTAWICALSERLAAMNQRSIAGLVPFDTDRARVLTAGTFLWAGVLNRLGANRVVVSVRGLRWGVAARLAEQGRI
jgi:exopolyphosphatase/guanosine-5'-triphosphate,3'-diphosphate pyrophosphatase